MTITILAILTLSCAIYMRCRQPASLPKDGTKKARNIRKAALLFDMAHLHHVATLRCSQEVL